MNANFIESLLSRQMKLSVKIDLKQELSFTMIELPGRDEFHWFYGYFPLPLNSMLFQHQSAKHTPRERHTQTQNPSLKSVNLGNIAFN